MIKVLILGGSGMLGHKLWQAFASSFDTYATFRGASARFAPLGSYDPARALSHVAAQDFDSIVRACAQARPDVVINCIGIVKQDAAAKDPLPSINVNALLPHRLGDLCAAIGARLIHISTDCVFSGRAGHYTETDTPDATDLYGRTKLLGEVPRANCLTIRTSIIGRELAGAHGLVEWFFSQRGSTVRGFTKAVFSGWTTTALAEVLRRIIMEQAELSGLWHVAAEPINKFELLKLVRAEYELEIEIEVDETFVCDRSLDATRFRAATGLVPPTWPEMIAAMRADTTDYDELRRKLC